ncbi:MAG TPA: bacterioferritin [Candidatus Binataceae bacterium]|nr:bacterioferritin [Candidatus Binataceae bacterium]
MKTDPRIIQFLNLVLRNELTAINQYFLHSRQLKHWGTHKLGEYEYKESIAEMRHADAVIERVLFLEGLPNLQDLDRLLIGENVKEVLDADLRLERKALGDLRDAIAYVEGARDFATRDLLQKILVDEEAHVDFIETQLDMIARMGLENYIQLQSSAA